MENEKKNNKRYDDNVIFRASLVVLVVFLAMIPLTISATPGIALWEQIWIAFALSAIGVLFGVLLLGVAAEVGRRIHAISHACLKAVRGDRGEATQNENNALQAG